MGMLVECVIVTRMSAALQACSIYVCSLNHPGG